MNDLEEMLQSFKSLYTLMQDKELHTAIAKMYKGIVDSLEAEGFSREQAMEIATKFNVGGK